MTFRTSLPRARRSRRHQPVDSDWTRPHRLFDPTRPAPVRIVDGVPIAHEGPPGFPGESAAVSDEVAR